jgi:hypothetical protein
MGKVRDILIHVEVEVAAKQRICHHNRKEHAISKGLACLAIYDSDGARKNYCSACAQEILTKAKTKLLGIEEQLQ